MPDIDSLFGPGPSAAPDEPKQEPAAQSLDALFGDLPMPASPGPRVQEGDDKQHVRHSPSSAPRWTRCPGSIIATDGLESKAGDAADEGTAAHWMLETGILEDKDAAQIVLEHPTILGQNKRWPSGGEMESHIGPLIDEYRKESKKRGVFVIPERKLFLHEKLGLPEPVGGTADITIFRSRQRQLGIEDLKYGKSIMVKAYELDQNGNKVPNEQLMTYLAAAYFDWLDNHKSDSRSPVEKLYICIRQPRAKKKRDRKSVYECTVDELLAWVEWFKARFYATLEPDAPRIPGEKQCTFCLAKGKPDRCPEYATKGASEANRFLQTVADHMPSGMTTQDLFAKDPTRMSVVELNAARLLVEDYERQIKAIKLETEERLLSGQNLGNWRLAHGNSTRYLSDAVEATKIAEKLVSDGVERHKLFEPPKPEALLSPAQLEKALGPDLYEQNFKAIEGRLAGKATVVPADSKKASYDPKLVGTDANDDFVAELPATQEK